MSIQTQIPKFEVPDRLRKAREWAHLEQIELRHAFITALFDTTSNARVVQELARHASLATTQGYAHVQHEAMRRAIGKLAA